MIEINLVPPNLRKRKATQILLGGLKIPPEVIWGVGGGLIVLLAFIYISLLMMTLVKVTHGKYLKKQWEDIATSKQNVDSVLGEMRSLQAKLKTIEEITSPQQKIFWSQKLNVLSDSCLEEFGLGRYL